MCSVVRVYLCTLFSVPGFDFRMDYTLGKYNCDMTYASFLWKCSLRIQEYVDFIQISPLQLSNVFTINIKVIKKEINEDMDSLITKT